MPVSIIYQAKITNKAFMVGYNRKTSIIENIKMYVIKALFFKKNMIKK